MRVFVTGASGFIGGVLCEQLRQRGHEVSALVRRPRSEPPGTRPVAGDLSDQSALSKALREGRPDCVIHLAAEIASQRDQDKIHAVNVEGTERLVGACREVAGPGLQGPPHLVFASTVVTGEAHGALLTEETPLPIKTPYGRSKQQGERLILDSGLPSTVIRPSHVYGPGGWYAEEIVSRLRRPLRLAVVGSGRNLWDVVHVQDVSSALILAAELRAPSGAIYHVVDDEPISSYDFMALSAQALEVGPPRRIPSALARLVAGGNAVEAVVRSARSSNAKIKRELGWRPRFPSAREGVPDAVGHLGAA
jgi:nucleoside-diphosphate-sugar epimerase